MTLLLASVSGWAWGGFGSKAPTNLVSASAWLSGGAPAGTEIVRHARIYAGPIQYEVLESLGVGLESLANLGWKWLVPLSVLLLKILNLLYKAIPTMASQSSSSRPRPNSPSIR